MGWSVGNLRETKHGVRCDRTSKLGNPFLMRSERDRPSVCKGYRKYLYLVAMTWEDPQTAALMVCEDMGLTIATNWKAPQQHEMAIALTHLQESPDAVLLCWCHPKECHCGVIIKYLEYCQQELEADYNEAL